MGTYAVKEIHYTLQGEGAQSGRPAVFVRFSGCNLWSGREIDRHKAICQFCDTDFWGTDGVNGGKYTAEDLTAQILSLWPSADQHPYVVCTGGEPTLQLNKALIKTFKEAGIEIAIETNGTQPLPDGVDWVCMSPKANTEIAVTKGDEIKIVFPQSGIEPAEFEHMGFTHFFIQPMDGPDIQNAIKACVDFCKTHPRWKLSVQTHKVLNIP